VDRAQYARYLLSRLAQSLLIMLGAAMLAHLLRLLGWPRWAATGPSGGILPAARYVAWPALCALAAHLLLGPKQARPVYRRMPGAMFVYAGVKVSRSAGCRGGLITGSTGSGKTLCCIMPRLHSLCVNESGSELPSWRRSRARRELEEMRRLHRRLAAEEGEHGSRLGAARQAAAARGNTLRALRAMGSAALGPSEPSPGVSEIDAELARMRTQAQARAARLAELADACRPARYRCAPWGGFVCGEKGNEWRSIAELLACHGRQEDLCLLATRPSWAPPDWRPAVRLNLICMGGVPADTYAQMIVDTALSVEESATRDEFFVPQARDKIAWGLRLVRAIGAGGHRPAASLLTVLDILTVQESYRRYLAESVAERPHLASSAALDEARFQLENNYWNQPPDQLGGVRSTVHNFLAPFAEPEIAEVFCADSTFDLRDIELGKVVCLAIPQRLAVQRRYVATLIKALVYRIVVERFDRRHDAPGWAERNVILVEQDEWQRHAVRADCEVDIVREAQGAVYAATQSQNAVWLKLGGRDRAAPLMPGGDRRMRRGELKPRERADLQAGLLHPRRRRQIDERLLPRGAVRAQAGAALPRPVPRRVRPGGGPLALPRLHRDAGDARRANSRMVVRRLESRALAPARPGAARACPGREDSSRRRPSAALAGLRAAARAAALARRPGRHVHRDRGSPRSDGTRPVRSAFVNILDLS